MRLVIALVAVLVLNGMFFMAQKSTDALAVDMGLPRPSYFDTGNNIIGNFDNGNMTIKPRELPSDAVSVDPSTSSYFTDAWKSIINALRDVPGLGYVMDIATAFHSFMAQTGAPGYVVFALDFIWYGMCFFLIILFIRSG